MKSCLFVGVDTHKDFHIAAVLDGCFEVVATVSFDNDKAGFAKFEEKLKKFGNGGELIFGLEDSQGLRSFLASYLAGKGYKTLEINPR